MTEDWQYRDVCLLLIEDNPNDSKMFNALLSNFDTLQIDFNHCPTLNEGIHFLNTKDADIVFLDMSLPDSDKLEGLHAIQTRFPDKAVIMLTGEENEIIGMEAVRTGAQDYLIKSDLDGDLLSRVIRHSIERKKIEMKLKQAKRNLEAGEAKFRSLIEKNADAIIIVNRKGLIQFVNPAAEALWGLSAEDLLGYAFGHPVLQKQFAEIEIWNRQGFPNIAEMRSTQIEWSGEQANLISLRNVTEKKKLEDETKKTAKLAAMAHLSGGIAHDFNNSLTVIAGNLQMAKNTVLPDNPVYRWLTRAENACARAESLSNLLLNFSKKEKPVKKRIFLHSVFDYPGWLELNQRNISTSLDIPDEIWQIEAEVNSIREAFKYLTDNSEDAMPAGGKISVKGANIDDGHTQNALLEKKKFVKITFTDQGTGIPKKNISNIFDPYFSTKPGKIGLGLSLAYSIIKRHDGIIEVDTTPGPGTTFWVYLPAYDKDNNGENINNGTLIVDE